MRESPRHILFPVCISLFLLLIVWLQMNASNLASCIAQSMMKDDLESSSRGGKELSVSVLQVNRNLERAIEVRVLAFFFRF